MIRKATIKDLSDIARVHQLCFPNSYSSQLGRMNLPIGGIC